VVFRGAEGRTNSALKGASTLLPNGEIVHVMRRSRDEVRALAETEGVSEILNRLEQA
jgi:hypothetical protein